MVWAALGETAGSIPPGLSPERACEAAQISRVDFDRRVELIATRERVRFWWTMGVNQGHESTRPAQAIINLALMTGNIGRPGTGANGITGQCNAMGFRLLANVTSLPAGRDFRNPEHRREVAELLQLPSDSVPTTRRGWDSFPAARCKSASAGRKWWRMHS
jgi:assimilatory nitrate reductase catalytic subunit